jgi:hypothetical protein
VDEVEGHVDSSKRCVQAGTIQNIAADNFGGAMRPCPYSVRVTCKTADAKPALLKSLE